MGGEKTRVKTKSQERSGSPPRGRGKAGFRLMQANGFGITPAWAGKSYLIGTGLGDTKDHPRVGGEKYRFSRTSMCTKGSPPRGRGKGSERLPKRGSLGITPAWAGKSQTESCGTTSSGDHPRVGGEKRSPAFLLHCFSGSPPRGRGKEKIQKGSVAHGRITPAWAGKRAASDCKGEKHEDHPRVGGEKLYAIAAFCSMWGSPPRGRGKAPRKRTNSAV